MATAKKRSTKVSKMQSFAISKSNKPFMTFQFTEQTVYWVILLALIAILFMWVLNIQIDTLRAISPL
jgi:hypothetical protein